MGETFVRPSELHLKKEISVLRKARFLRDPDTCSSWRSPLASRSAAAHSNFSIASEGFPANNSSGFFDVDRSPNLSLRKENPPKKVYLYNWGHHYSKSSDTGVKLGGDDKKNLPQASPDGSPINLRELDSKRGKFLDKPIPDFGTGRTGPVTTTRRNARKFRRPATAKHRNSRDSASPKLLDISSRPPGILDSMEQSDGSEDCNSEDLHLSTRELIRRTGYASSSTSPFLSGSGCGNWSCSSRILKNAKKEESSCSVTPASTSSFNRYGQKRPSTIGSWDGTTASFDGDEARPAELSSHRGHAASRYSSKRVKDRGCGGWYSPSLSDTLRRKGSSILCGSQNLRHKRKSAAVRKQKLHLRASQGLPLLTNGCDEDRSLMGIASDALSTSFGELELEALSRLDGKRWSHCGNQEGLVMPLPTGFAEMPSHRSLSQKYRPRSFGEIIGQNIIVHSLQNAILRRRIAPAYLFHGSHGTGKTSTARIFAGALNCLSTGEKKPCGFCRECTELASGNGTNIREVDATNKRDIDRIRNLLKNMHELSSSSSFKIFIVDECHILSSKVWSAFIKFLEEPPSRIVFVFITVDPDNLPRAILSRCQKYLFSKIKEVDIVSRLRRLSAEEGFDVELDALDLIALNSDGSLSDAETMLDQLGLLGKTITSSLVHDLVGVVSEEKLIDLLEIAMSSDTAETVRRSRELMDSGVDPVALMSQLAGLIMDIIAGTYRLNSSRADKSVLRGQNLADAELERLQQALKILSDAEKQLRLSSERSTWFTAALLQLGSDHSPEHKQSSSGNSKRSPQKSMTGTGNWGKGTSACKSQPVGGSLIPTICGEKSGAESFMTSPEKLKVVWQKCIEKCHSRTLRQLLSTYGRLISIFEAEGVLVVSVAFNDEHIRARAEGYLSSITNSMEIILGHHVQVRIGSALDDYKDGLPHFTDPIGEQTIVSLLDKERKLTERSNALLGKGSHEEPLHLVRKRSSTHERKLQRAANTCESSQGPLPSAHGANAPQFSPKENDRIVGNEDTSEMPRIQTLATDEQRLESAWLQTMEKGTTGLVKPERNQILPQNGSSYQHQNMSKLALGIQSNHWDDELNHEIKALKINDTSSQHKEEFIGKIGVISPSLLHRSAFNENFGIQNPDFESGPDCNGLLCFRASKPGRRKVKQRTRVGSQKAGHLLPFGRCMKTKTTESSFRR